MTQDVTASANWTIADPTIIRSNGPGMFTAVGTGDTYVLAAWQNTLSGGQTVSVLPNTPPLPTYEIDGDVWQAGSTPASSYIGGAVIQVLDGLVAGRTATSGVPPPLLPGYLGPFQNGPGGYRISGVPPGIYHLQVTKTGYVTQQVTVTVVGAGGAVADFQLQPS
jgi:hypothetical protein